MSENIELVATKRDIKESKNKIRKNKSIPAIVYGAHISAFPVAVSYVDFEKVYRQVGYSQIFLLKVGDAEKSNVLISEVQKDPVKDTYIHVDFHAIRMDEKITANIPVKYVGISSAVKDKEGVLIKNIDELEIECLPKDLPREITVDISVLQELNSSIRIRDLKGYEHIKINADVNEVLATVAPPRSKEELEGLEEKVEEKVDEIEGVKKVEKVEEGEEKDEKKDEKKEEKSK